MSMIRKALLITTQSKWVKSLFKIILAILFFIILFNWGNSLSAQNEIFSDLPNDPMYKSHILRFQSANVIVGDTELGQPIGQIRPNDSIHRAEFAKVAVLVRLLENAYHNGEGDHYQNLSLNDFTFEITEPLEPYYKAQEGARLFTDVRQKDESCASNPSGCEPWYTEYVNYASMHGMIHGYDDDTFRPGNPILRLHSLKLIMANDGSIPANSDDKFERLTSDPRIENVNRPKCLEGAEKYILDNNGGPGFDAYNLLSYAILADKLDFFGSNCELFIQFDANSPEERADLLQEPLTRQEIARYFALSSSYPPLQSDHQADNTTATKEENGMTYFEKSQFEFPEFETIIPLDKDGGDFLSIIGTEAWDSLEEEEKMALIELNRTKAEMSIQELVTDSKQGRCCSEMILTSSCPLTDFKDYQISEDSSYNYQTYDGGVWHAAKNGQNTCWIPFRDILGGYDKLEFNKEICQVGQSDQDLINHYLNVYLKMEVTTIWMREESKPLKFYRQLSLDVARELAKQINEILNGHEPSCNEVNSRLNQLHMADESIKH